jgi:hypothetical protein
VERWNGTEWSAQELPQAAKKIHDEVTGVSCASTTACIAVGRNYNSITTPTFFAERWNGTAWSIQEPTTPTGATNTSLSSVACSTTGPCIAVGYYISSASVETLLAERWNGTEWTIAEPKIPTGAKSSTLSSVSCTSSEACTVVGHYINSSGVEVPLAERWNGTTWAIQETKIPTGAKGTSLAAVSCNEVKSCTAAGRYVNSSNVEVPLAERWNGTTWSIQETKIPTGAKSSSLSAISCSASEACTATGRYVNSSSVELPLVERWNGATWAIQEIITPTEGEATSVAGVVCTATKECIAVGGYTIKGTVHKLLAEHWNGTTWSIHSTPSTKRKAGVDLYGVSCPETKLCTAVGEYEESSGAFVTLAEQWNGTKWSAQATPNPSGAQSGVVLKSVSCVSSTACTAVGYYKIGTETRILAEGWNGTTWSIQATGTTQGFLNGVSCTTATACTAVGSNGGRSLAERWNGTEWSAQEAPKPGESRSDQLVSVSCTSATSCTAAGSYSGGEKEGFGTYPLAESWNGTKWTLQTVPRPTEKSADQLFGVSCSSSPACTAVGENETEAPNETLAERWNGTEWALQSALNPAAENELLGVSCPSGTACTAVGFTRAEAGKLTLTLAEAWNGTEWVVQTTPNPSETTFTELKAVSCASVAVCTAVGVESLAEHYE